MSEKIIRILHILTGGNSFTGVSSYLYQYYRNMDRSRVRFDFLFCKENNMKICMDEEIFDYSEFFALNAKTKRNSTNYVKLAKGIRKVLKEHEYDILIVNTSVIMTVMTSYLAVPRGKRPLFIAHAHNTDIIVKSSSLRGKVKSLFKIADCICRRIVVKKADYLFACSKEAGKATFGDAAIQLSKFKVINNAIDTDAFIYDRMVRSRVREKAGIDDRSIVYGNVGQLSYRKNQTFLLKIFQEICKRNPDSSLWLIGDGPERNVIEDEIKKSGLQDKVRLWGQRSDVNELMQGMDCFVFTTISEGLGIVAIESQATGLPTVISDGVPADVMISDLAIQLPLSAGPEQWADSILTLPVTEHRRSMRDCIIRHGYDIQTEAEKFTVLLISILRETGSLGD